MTEPDLVRERLLGDVYRATVFDVQSRRLGVDANDASLDLIEFHCSTGTTTGTEKRTCPSVLPPFSPGLRGISEATFYVWKKRFGHLDVHEVWNASSVVTVSTYCVTSVARLAWQIRGCQEDILQSRSMQQPEADDMRRRSGDLERRTARRGHG